MTQTKQIQQQENVALAVVRVRGEVGLHPDVKRTFDLLRLRKKHACVVVNFSNAKSMLKRVKDFTTFGEIDKEVLVRLLRTRGRLAGNAHLTEEFVKDKMKMNFEELAEAVIDGKVSLNKIPGFKPFFRLAPPAGGFERNGIKRGFGQGGVLGYRAKKINKLLEKMI
ncbi:MAG: 50S ribosomal protein L30 [DPANN group archaeon]|nr:50S ribosomal protein L30 [DPANN group archaeon]